jgi:hypothetical protein
MKTAIQISAYFAPEDHLVSRFECEPELRILKDKTRQHAVW